MPFVDFQFLYLPKKIQYSLSNQHVKYILMSTNCKNSITQSLSDGNHSNKKI